MPTLKRFKNIKNLFFSIDQKSLVVETDKQTVAFDLISGAKQHSIPDYTKTAPSPDIKQRSFEDSINIKGFSPDNKFYLKAKSWEPVLLCQESNDKVVKSFSIETYDDANACDCVFSHDGKLIAIGTMELEHTGSFFVFDIASAKKIGSQTNGCAISKIAFSVNGDHIAYGDFDGVVRIYSLKQKQVIATEEIHSSYLSELVFTPQGDQVVSFSSEDCKLYLWNYRALSKPSNKPGVTNAQQDISKRKLLHSQHEYMLRIVFSPDAKRMVTIFSNGASYLWDCNTMCLIATLIQSNMVILEGRISIAMAFSGDSQEIICINDGGFYKWEAQQGKLIKQKKEHIWFWDQDVFSPDGKILSTVKGDHLQLIDTNSFDTKKIKIGASCTSNLAFSCDGKLLTLGCGGDLYVLCTENEQLTKIQSTDVEISSIAFSKNSNHIAFINNQNGAVYNLKSKKMVWQFNLERPSYYRSKDINGKPLQICFREDEHLLIQKGKKVEIWDWQQQVLVNSVEGSIWSWQKNTPYTLVYDEIDMVAKSTKTGEEVKRFDINLGEYTPGPDGKSWAGWSGKNTIYYLQID